MLIEVQNGKILALPNFGVRAQRLVIKIFRSINATSIDFFAKITINRRRIYPMKMV